MSKNFTQEELSEAQALIRELKDLNGLLANEQPFGSKGFEPMFIGANYKTDYGYLRVTRYSPDVVIKIDQNAAKAMLLVRRNDIEARLRELGVRQ